MTENLRPAIRFDEFTDDWEQRKFSELYCRSNEKNDGSVGIERNITVATMQFKPEVQVASEEYLKTYFTFKKGDIAFEGHQSKEFRYGRFVENDIGNGIVSHIFAVFRPVAPYDLFFWKYAINNESLMQKVLSKSTKASTMMHDLVTEDFLRESFLVPSIEEQKEIGAFFHSLDHLITLHQNRYDKIVNIRASMLGKLFVQDGDSPQIRFGEYKTPWKKVKLGEIVVPYSDPVETPHDGYERLGIRSHGKGVFHDYVEAGKELGTAQMHKVASHNLIVNITFAWEHAVAITDDNDAGKLVSHRFPQFAMTDDIYDQFLKYMILDARFRHHLLLSSPGGAGRNRVLKVPEMLEYEMMIPEVEEQKQIASYLNSLDELIGLYKVRVEKLKNIKMACLQKMFV